MFRKSQEIYSFDEISFKEHIEIFVDMIYVIRCLQRIDEDYSALKVSGCLSHFICKLSLEDFKKQFDDYNLFNLYCLLNNSLKAVGGLDDYFSFETFEEQLYMQQAGSSWSKSFNRLFKTQKL